MFLILYGGFASVAMSKDGRVSTDDKSSSSINSVSSRTNGGGSPSRSTVLSSAVESDSTTGCLAKAESPLRFGVRFWILLGELSHTSNWSTDQEEVLICVGSILLCQLNFLDTNFST
jgi:hypothetical protein